MQVIKIERHNYFWDSMMIVLSISQSKGTINRIVMVLVDNIIVKSS